MHILILLVKKIQSDDIDSCQTICVEMSDPKHDFILHEIVKNV